MVGSLFNRKQSAAAAKEQPRTDAIALLTKVIAAIEALKTELHKAGVHKGIDTPARTEDGGYALVKSSYYHAGDHHFHVASTDIYIKPQVDADGKLSVYTYTPPQLSVVAPVHLTAEETIDVFKHLITHSLREQDVGLIAAYNAKNATKPRPS